MTAATTVWWWASTTAASRSGNWAEKGGGSGSRIVIPKVGLVLYVLPAPFISKKGFSLYLTLFILLVGVKCLAPWSTDYLVTGSYDTTVRVHDSRTWETKATLLLHSKVRLLWHDEVGVRAKESLLFAVRPSGT